MKKVVIWLLLLGVAGGLGGWYWRGAHAATVTYRTTAVRKGDLAATISATGTVEPEEVVDVGAQVAGQIQSFGEDPHHTGKTVDYGTEVEEGTVLAKIDDALYASDVQQAKAQLAQAKANVQRAEADLLQMKAKVQQTQRDWRRAEQLGPSRGVISGLDYDTTKATYETAVSVLAVGDAAVVQAKSGVDQAQAALTKAEKNLGYCTIRSPVKGVVVDRRVNIGQTVVSSLNAPSLFLIAKDLRKIQVWASVNEADIGQIHPDQSVRFTVDAFPGAVFVGSVGRIRLNATMTQNVVTYMVEINTDNSSGKLLPYMTANVQFEVARHPGVLLVPNAALRWTPPPAQVAPEAREELPRLVKRRPGERGSSDGDTADKGVLWVAEGPFVRPLRVKVGLTDGLNTEVSGEGMAEGTDIVVGEVRQAQSNGATNPFAPQLFGGKKGG